jgi:hypothetical protein
VGICGGMILLMQDYVKSGSPSKYILMMVFNYCGAYRRSQQLLLDDINMR